MYSGLHVTHPVSLSDFNYTRIFSPDFRKIQTRKFMKIYPEEAELFRAAGKTDGHEEANDRFWQFSKLA